MPVAGPVWTAEEDDMLRRLVAQHGTKKWAHLATIIKSKKSKQEDALLREGHSKYGNKWTEIAKMVGGRTDNAVKNRWASLTKKNPRLAHGSPSSVPSASADSSFSGSMPSQSRSAQSNSVSMQPTRLPGTRPSRLRSLAQTDDAQPNQMSTSNSGTRSRYQGSTESGPTVMTHPHLKGLTVRTHAKSEHGSDGSGSGRTPGSVNIRVWKDSLTPKERQSAQEVNALGLPVTIHLEDQMIPLPQAYAVAGNSEAKDQMAEGNGLWRTDTDGDIAKWLNIGSTPRAGGMLKRGQSFANGQSSGEQAMEGMIESPRLEVLVTPNFSSQELNMLLEALGNEEMADMGGSAPLQHTSSLGVFM
ncbi:MAG: hypothetical protein FRX49_11732 [Trebouxia sp. A1-2]|nr:MAG: hypothetical protein FRX49_11732 [Trebouxia sp. A1-2]